MFLNHFTETICKEPFTDKKQWRYDISQTNLVWHYISQSRSCYFYSCCNLVRL